MEGFLELLLTLKRKNHAKGSFLGLLHVLIGGRIATSSGTEICTGLSWRVLAQALKKVRWDKNAVRELGLNPKELPPRDRERFWYAAIAQAQVGSAKAVQAGERFAETLRSLGYSVGSACKQTENRSK
jgi:hypothetical protein